MDKLTIVGHFTKTVEILRNTECSQKEKLMYFHQISDYILSPQMISHINFSKHCTNAIGVLLFFCEDLDSIVRMNAEENLNRIIRSLETTRTSRILLDLYNEIKKNGNQKSLRICLNLFAYYCHRIKEKNVKWYALKMIACIEMIATRKETLLIETLSEFMKSFAKNFQCCLSDNEIFKLMEVFLNNITSDCAVKRRCSAQNCITLLENSKNKYFMTKNCLNRSLDFLINDQQQTANILLGVLGYFRLLLPIIIFENLTEPKQIIEIYDFCLYLLNNQNHSIINASLEVINSILNRLPDNNSTTPTTTYIKSYDNNDTSCTIEEFLTNRNSDRLRHNEILKKRKSLKNQIFQLNKKLNSTCGSLTMVEMMPSNEHEKQQHKYQKSKKHNFTITMMAKHSPELNRKNEQQQQILTKSTTSETIGSELNKGRKKNISFDDENIDRLDNSLDNKTDGKNLSGRSASNFFVSLEDDKNDEENSVQQELMITMEEDKENSDGFTTLSELNDSNDDGDNNNQLLTKDIKGNDILIDDKSQIMSDIDNESFNSIDFDSEITIGAKKETGSIKKSKEHSGKNDWKLQKSTDSIGFGSLFNSFLSQGESMTKLFRPSTKSATTEQIDNSATSTPNFKKRSTSNLVEQRKISHINIEDDTISLESINSHISFGSHVSNQSNSTQEYQISKNDQDLVMMMTTKLVKQNLQKGNIDEKNLNLQQKETNIVLDDLEQNKRSSSTTDQIYEKSSSSSLVDINLRDKTMIDEDIKSKEKYIENLDDNKKDMCDFNKFDIGTIYDQPIIYYTTRLITSKFLLTGSPVTWENYNNYSSALISDTQIRVSIKNLALLVIGNCIKLMPEILYLSIEMDKIVLNQIREFNLAQSFDDSVSISSSSSSKSITANTDDSIAKYNDSPKITYPKNSLTELKSVTNHPLDNDDDDDNLLLNIKDDHFGENTTKNLFDNSLSQSADQAILTKFKNFELPKNKNNEKQLTKTNINQYHQNQNEIILSKSEIIETKTNLFKNRKISSSAAAAMDKRKHEPKTKNRTDNNQTLIELSASNFIGENEKKNSCDIKKQQQHSYIQQQILWLNKTDRDTQMMTINDYKKQFIHDILLFYNHSDPILRGDVQVIIGNFIYGMLLLSSNQYYNRFSGFFYCGKQDEQEEQLLHPLNINRLLAILIKGFRDDIHTVVIQAMSSFDKIFPIVMARHFNMMPKGYYNNQHSRRLQHSTDILYKDNDVDNSDFLENLLMLKPINDYNIQQKTITTKTNNFTDPDNNNKFYTTKNDNRTGILIKFLYISPKFLLNELRLCYHNKYWLVQNKYTEVVSNLKYDDIREFYSDDVVCSYEKMFFNEIIQFLGDEDTRVREQTIDNLCYYIKNRNYHKNNNNHNNNYQNTNKYDINNDSYQYYCNNFNLIKEFLNYHIFYGMSVTLGNLLNTNYLPSNEIEKLLSRILYILTNKLMEINDKNMQFGIITAVKIMLNEFNPVDYFDVWNEFNFSTICIQYSTQNYTTAIDLNCQNDLIEITTKLLSAQFLSGKINNQQLNENLLVHIMKILNIYYHILGNQKPVLFIKTQKSDLFTNAKELAITNLNGYFGNDYLYIKLYNIIKGAFDNYKIIINHESGKKIMSLLKTCLNSLAACLEMKDHSTTNIPTTASSSSSAAGLEKSNIGNIQFTTNSITNQTVKFIDEILQYLSILINYKPVETIGCLRQLLKYLFGRNYANRQNEYGKFIKFYLMARNLKKYSNSNNINNKRKNQNHFVIDDDDNNENENNILENLICLKQKNNQNIDFSINKEITTAIFNDDGPNIKNTKKFMNIKNLSNDKYYNKNEEEYDKKYQDEEKKAFITIFRELFSNSMNFPLGKSKSEEECARHIKLFEPLVIFCLSLFMKSNAKVQGPILDLLSQLLEFNVTYSILDSKSVIFEQVLKNLELIESGIARNSTKIINPIIRFLVNITNQNDKKLMNIPKIISITNSLLANNYIKECSLLALKSLAFEIFFIMDDKSSITNSSIPVNDLILTVNAKELNTQKEVIIGMLEKFIDSPECLKVFGILMIQQNIMKYNNIIGMECHLQQQLKQSSAQHTEKSWNFGDDENDNNDGIGAVGGDDGYNNICVKNEYSNMNKEYLSSIKVQDTGISPSSIQNEVIFSIVIKGLVDGKINVNNWNNFFVLDSLFRNNDKNVLLDSKGFLSLLSLFITKTVKNFNDLSISMIILDNVILKTEEIYLVNHIKLYLKNHESQQDELNNITRTTNNEIKYFAKVLYKKLDECFITLQNIPLYRYCQQHQNQQQQQQHYPYNSNNNDNNICNINTNNKKFVKLIVKFIKALNKHISKRDALKSAFRYELIENEFWENYYNNNNNNNKFNYISYSNIKVEIINIFCEFELNAPIPDKISIFMKLIKIDQQHRNVQRELLRKIIQKFNEPKLWTLPEIEIFLTEFLWIGLNDFEKFINNLCKIPEYLEIFIKKLSKYFDEDIISKEGLQVALKYINNTKNIPFEKKIELLTKVDNIRSFRVNNKTLENIIEQIIENDIESQDKKINIIKNLLGKTQFKFILNKLDNHQEKDNGKKYFIKFDQKIVDENWLMEQIIQYSSIANPDEYVKILLDIKSEIKLKQIFNHSNFNLCNILKSSIEISFKTMINSFQNDCIQYNPHINYMNMNSLLRVSINTLKDKLDYFEINNFKKNYLTTGNNHNNIVYLPIAIISLFENIKYLENISLMYIEYRLIEKFIKDHILKSETLIDTLIQFILLASNQIKEYLIEDYNINKVLNDNIKSKEIYTYLKCINILLNEKYIWFELNQSDKYDIHLNTILDFLYYGMIKSICNTIFYKKYQIQIITSDYQQLNDYNIIGASTNTRHSSNNNRDKYYQVKQDIERNFISSEITNRTNNTDDDNIQLMLPEDKLFEQKKQEPKYSNMKRQQELYKRNIIEKAIFIGKLIETNCCVNDENSTEKSSMEILKSIAISLLRMNKFYAYAVTPFEIYQSGGYEDHYQGNSNISSKLPTIPVEHLSDVDVLEKFVKRLSIFGFTSRQQFEEYFMTFLLLINTVYDENMVDVQEQFQIKNTCFEAILELLITYKTFPIVGNKLSRFHHSTRLPKIRCDSISLKKLHKVQLLLPETNVFYQSNLERNLSMNLNCNDNIIGSKYFLPNQYDLNFVWHLMENSVSSSMTTTPEIDIGFKEDIFIKNFRYFRQMSEIDFKSSAQLIFDVLTQFIDQNHVLVLPNLVKFCEICENRDQVKWIKLKVLKLQETIPIDDIISHQHIIYLLCKTQSMLIPSTSDLSHLCTIISTYLKSSHVFIRNATLHGLLCLLECCSKTNTTIGKLSEELSILRDLIIGYITRHGIIEESSIVFSDLHTKLIWTLNFYLIEMTTKFVPDCNLLSNTIISANNLLKRTSNESVYLCVLHGLERIIVMDVAPLMMRNKIEKLALELLKLDNEKFSISALKLLLSCIYMGSAKQLENTELSNGIVQDDPEIIAQQTDKLDILLHCIKSSTKNSAKIYGQVLCQIIRDLVPPKEILTKVIKEFLAINQPHCDVIARIVHQVFRSAIDSSFLQMLQEWLICTLPTFVNLPEEKSVWFLTIIFISASINLHLIKLFPVVLNENEFKLTKINLLTKSSEITLFLTSAKDFYSKLSQDQKLRFREAFQVSDVASLNKQHQKEEVEQQQDQEHQEDETLQWKVFQLMLESL